MRRANLKSQDVTRIIVTSTMTPWTTKVTPESLMEQRRRDGFFDVGWHYFVDKWARVHFGVPVTERGSYFARYSRNSVVLLIEGGGDYSEEQFRALRRLIQTTQREYPAAEPTLHHELFRGINPMFGKEKLDAEA